MSGVEIIGVVASIVQIAELGGRLSVKLCTFCHKFKNTDKALRHLSKDVALTCNVLRQLGESLGQDDLACLYSPDAFETAQDVLRECEEVFQDLESAIEQHYPNPFSQSRVDKMARKFKFMMNESHLDTVAGNLERLKSTMLLMLNVVIYAGQIRSRREAHELQEQRNLLMVLTSEKIESERNYERLTRTLQYTSITEKGPHTENLAGGNQPEEIQDELYHYCQMVKSVLHDINAVQQLLDRDRYSRVRSGFMNVHRAEASVLQRIHGQRAIVLFHTHLGESFQVDTSIQARNPLNSAQEPARVLPNLQSAINFNRANAIPSPPSQLNASSLSPQQIRERASMMSREFHRSQHGQEFSGQTHQPQFQQTRTQPLDLSQARAMQLQLQQQMMQQQMQRPQAQGRHMMQAPPVPRMQLRPSINQIDQLPSRRPPGMHQSEPPDPGDLDLPIISPPPYQPRARSWSEIPDNSPAANGRRASPAIPITQPSESNVEQSSPDHNVPDTTAFNLDFSSSDNREILDSFDFDTFFAHDDNTGFAFDGELLNRDQVSSEGVPSEHEENPQPDQPMCPDSGESVPKRKKRKAKAVASAQDGLESQSTADSVQEDGQSKRVHLDSRNSTDESSPTVASPVTNAGTDTHGQVLAATEGQPSASEDTPTEDLDAWILRWTILEQTELK